MLQVWTPPYLLNGKPRPTIENAPKTLSYNKTFSFGFSGVSAVDRVVINRVISATHGNHFDQRQVRFTSEGRVHASLQHLTNSVSRPFALLDTQGQIAFAYRVCLH